MDRDTHHGVLPCRRLERGESHRWPRRTGRGAFLSDSLRDWLSGIHIQQFDRTAIDGAVSRRRVGVPALQHLSGSDFHGRQWQSIAWLYYGCAGHTPDRFDQRAVQSGLITLSLGLAISGYAWGSWTTNSRRTFPLCWRSQTCAPQADGGRFVPL